MTVITTVRLPADDFVLGSAFATDPTLTVRLERLIPTRSTIVPYFWISDSSIDAIDDALGAVDDIASFTTVDTLDGDALVRVEWAGPADGFFVALAATNGAILEGEGTVEGWQLRLRFDEHAHLTEFYRRCADNEVRLAVETVHGANLAGDHRIGTGDLTGPQRETLQLALDEGYFEVPRRTSAQDLAGELGVSDTAVSQRLRRALTEVLEATVAEE